MAARRDAINLPSCAAPPPWEALLYRLVQYAAPLLHKEATEAEIAEMKVAMGLGADEASTAVARLEVLARKMMTTDADVRRVAPYMPLVLLRRGELASFIERARTTS